MLEARWWYIPVFTDLLLLLVAGGTTGKGGGESGAGRPQSDQRWACEHPRLPSAPHQECSALQEGEDLGQGRTQAWGRVLVSRQVESLPQCLGWGWTRAGYTGARGGGKGSGHQGGRGRKRSSHQSTVLLFSASGQRFAGGWEGKVWGRVTGDPRLPHMPHLPKGAEPQGWGQAPSALPFPSNLRPQERGTEEGRKGHTDHFLLGETEMEGGRRTSTYPALPHLRGQKTERAIYGGKKH